MILNHIGKMVPEICIQKANIAVYIEYLHPTQSSIPPTYLGICSVARAIMHVSIRSTQQSVGTNIKNKLLLSSVVTKWDQLAENHRCDTHMQPLRSKHYLRIAGINNLLASTIEMAVSNSPDFVRPLRWREKFCFMYYYISATSVTIARSLTSKASGTF